jgi:hypothetical protein
MIRFLPLYMVMILIGGCTATKVATLTLYKLEVDERVKSQSNLSVRFDPIQNDADTLYPKLFLLDLNKGIPPLGGYANEKKTHQAIKKFYASGTVDNRVWVNPLISWNGQLIAGLCTIKNNTGHILRMKDARVYFRIPGEEPMPALAEFGSFETAIATYSGKGVRMPKDCLDKKSTLIGLCSKVEESLGNPDYPFGLAAALIEQNRRGWRLLPDVGNEVLPGDSLTGLIIFPEVRKDIPEGLSIALYDLTVKTDDAGNALEKTTIEFPLRSVREDWTWDRTAKKWVKQ